MSKGKANQGPVFGLSLALLMTVAGSLGREAVAAPAPVEESRPMGHLAGTQTVVGKIADEPVTMSISADSEDEMDNGNFNGTAHLLNTIERPDH